MRPQLNKDGVRYLLTPFRWTILMAVAFFIAAGRVDISRAWVAFGIHFLGAIGGAALLWRYAPGLANQRASIRQGTKKWDKVVLASYLFLVLAVTPIVAGLDVGRFQHAQMNHICLFLGIVFYLGFFILFHWAMLSNEHFEGSARIQSDRKHTVMTNGPYRLVRHPGYVGMFLLCFADSFIIGSYYSLVPSLLAACVTIIRTFLEDRMLRLELAGYPEYAQRIRYRLIPGLW